MYQKSGSVSGLIHTVGEDLRNWQAIDRKRNLLGQLESLGQGIMGCGCLLPLGVGFLWGFNIWTGVNWSIVWIGVAILLALGFALMVISATSSNKFLGRYYQETMMKRLLSFLEIIDDRVASIDFQSEIGFGTTDEQRVKVVKLTDKFDYPREETYVFKVFDANARRQGGGSLRMEATRRACHRVESGIEYTGTRDSNGIRPHRSTFRIANRMNEDRYELRIALPVPPEASDVVGILGDYKLLLKPSVEILEGREIRVTVVLESQEETFDLQPFSKLLDWALGAS